MQSVSMHDVPSTLALKKTYDTFACFQSISFGQTHLYWRDIIISPFWLRTMIIDIMVANCPVERERRSIRQWLLAIYTFCEKV